MACQNSVPFWHKKRAFFSLLYQILKAILEYSVIDIKMRNKDLWMHYADFRQTTLLMALFQYLMMFPENRSKVSGRLLGTECDSFLYLFTLFTKVLLSFFTLRNRKTIVLGSGKVKRTLLWKWQIDRQRRITFHSCAWRFLPLAFKKLYPIFLTAIAFLGL